jgi:hypothetical protein
VKTANERPQVGGDHYRAAGNTFQHWDLVLQFMGNRYLEGQISKYVCRWRLKAGAQDVTKAQHYCAKLIDALRQGTVGPQIMPVASTADTLRKAGEFCDAQGFGYLELRILLLCCFWQSEKCLEQLSQLLADLYTAARQHDADRTVSGSDVS